MELICYRAHYIEGFGGGRGGGGGGGRGEGEAGKARAGYRENMGLVRVNGAKGVEA